jgi:SAM-dependent methyltransferase
MPLTPSGNRFQYSGSELDSLAEAKNYYAWVLRQFEPYLGPTVIEVGAGIGTFSDYLLGSPEVQNLIAVEPATNTLPHLRERFQSDQRVKVLAGYLSDHYRSLSANAIAAVNVLEHVEDDAAFLTEAHASVVPGGRLLLFVPAIPAIYGSLDKVFEHHRRYTKATLRKVIESAGWTPRRIAYMNFPGIAAWFMAGRVLKKTSIAPADAKAYDRLVVPWISRLERLVPPPIGSNIIAIATRQ